MVVRRDMRPESHGEHHPEPMIDRARIADIPVGRLAGISRLARLPETYARRLQVQEKLTARVAHMIETVLSPRASPC